MSGCELIEGDLDDLEERGAVWEQLDEEMTELLLPTCTVTAGQSLVGIVYKRGTSCQASRMELQVQGTWRLDLPGKERGVIWKSPSLPVLVESNR
ncbi:MAG: hypothetical protein Q8P67_28990 [archaeon]|nr:hypothetical protein [archaeon]